MSQPSQIYWAPSAGNGYSNAIAVNQDIAAGSNVILLANTPGGVFSYAKTLPPGPTDATVIRKINITSPDNNAAASFVISGVGCPVDGNGNPTQLLGPITETIVNGPNNSSVPSANIYTVINSITPNGNVTNISVGFGPSGITAYTYIDYNRPVAQILGSVQYIGVQTNLQQTVYGSLNRPEAPTPTGGVVPFGVETNGVAFILPWIMNATATTNQVFISTIPLAVLWLNLSLIGPSPTSPDSLYFTVLQQGL